MRHEYKQTTLYATTAIALRAAYGVSRYVIKPAIFDALSSRGNQVVTAVGKTVMSNLLRPPSEPASHTNNQATAPMEQPSLTLEPVAAPPTLRLLEDLPTETRAPLAPQEQPLEDLVA